MDCMNCGYEIVERLKFCPECGCNLDQQGEIDFDTALTLAKEKGSQAIKNRKWRPLIYLIFMSALIILSVTVITGGAGIVIVPFVLMLGCAGPLIMLMFSRGLAKRAHGIKLIRENQHNTEAMNN